MPSAKRLLSTPTPPSTPQPGRASLHRSTRQSSLPPTQISKAPRHTLSELAAAMEDINIPSEVVPLELKAQCEQILKRAKELKKAEAVVAYWCCFSAAQNALKMPNRSAEGTKFLLTLLDTLERMKALLDTHDAIITEAAGAAYIENFALKVFMAADNDDRNGVTGKATIRKFVVAGQFIEVLRCFENGMTEEMEQKLQYARWKAADGAKALREGREPTSGPPIPDIEMNPLPAIPSDSPESGPSTLNGSPPRDPKTLDASKPSPAVTPAIVSPGMSPPQPRPKLPDIDTTGENLRTPKRNHSTGSGAWSTVATPGLADDEDKEIHFVQPSAPPAGLASPPRSPTGGDRKNVRFMGPDGAPLSPAQTYISVDSVAQPTAPPPTTVGTPPRSDVNLPAGPRGDSGASASVAPNPFVPLNGAQGTGMNGRQRGDSGASARPPGMGHTNGNGGRRESPKGSPLIQPSNPPPAPPPSLVSVRPGPASSNGGLGLTSGPPAPSARPLPVQLTRKQVDQAQKHAKWAISALDYDDYDTARQELRKALSMLGQ